MDTQIAIVQFLFKKPWKVLSDSLGANPALTSNNFELAPEALKFCSSQENCLIIASVSSKDDLIQLATFVKAARKSLKGTILKIVVVNATENKQFEKAIAKLGSIEILEPTVNVKALRFKMDFWMKAMRAQAKKIGTMTQKSLEVSKSDAPVETKAQTQTPALECESDIWILSKESDGKRILGRWMVKLLGPGPYVGSWSEVPNKPGFWTFQIKKSFIDQFIAGEGSWVYRGDQKPEFNWQENRWMFTGDDLELFFYDGKTAHSRFKVAAKALTIAANSVFAKTKEPMIIETFDKELVFKSEADVLKDQSLDFENEGDLGGNLEGQVKDQEKAGPSHLSGKVKNGQEEIDGNLEGDVDFQEQEFGNLEGKLKDQEEATGALKGKLKGHETENSASGPGEKDDPKKSSEDKKNHSQKSDYLSSLRGKLDPSKSDSSEEHKDETHKQHNEHLAGNWNGSVKTEYETDPKAKAERPRAAGTESSEGSPRGKGDQTDHLKSHWGGKGGADAVDRKDHSGPGAGEVKSGSLLDMKKSDSQHQTHYRNHNEAKEYEAGELGKNQHDGALGGKGQTDKLASHYGAGKKSGQPSDSKNESPLAGSGETDHMPGHLGRRNTSLSAAAGLGHEENKQTSATGGVKGKGSTDKLQGHYTSGKHPKGKAHEELSGEVDEVISELEDAIDSPKGRPAASVIPFASKAEEAKLEALIENALLASFITQGGQKYACKLDDYFDNSVIFICKAEGLRNSEKALIDLSIDYQSKKNQLSCEGVVRSIDQDGEGGFYVSVEVAADQGPKFETFMELLRNRQENIDFFLQKAKGIA